MQTENPLNQKPQSRRFVLRRLLSVALLLLLVGAAFSFWLDGGFPDFMEANDVVYEKTLDIKPSSGRIWSYCSGAHNGTYYYRLELSSADFRATDIPRLPPAPQSTVGQARGPIWWNPPSDAEWFIRPSMRHGFEDLLIYDARRRLLFARCEV
jgi:hypothetical protein